MVDEPINEDELEDMDDEDASLGDDVLDEVAGEDEEDTEGFGHIDETDVKEVSEEDDDEEEEDDAELEDDAEDVDYDSFDDVDEM